MTIPIMVLQNVCKETAQTSTLTSHARQLPQWVSQDPGPEFEKLLSVQTESRVTAHNTYFLPNSSL